MPRFNLLVISPPIPLFTTTFILSLSLSLYLTCSICCLSSLYVKFKLLLSPIFLAMILTFNPLKLCRILYYLPCWKFRFADLFLSMWMKTVLLLVRLIKLLPSFPFKPFLKEAKGSILFNALLHISILSPWSSYSVEYLR